jgi:hypothetical protein
MEFLNKIRKLEKRQREIIFWVIISCVVILFGSLFIINSQKRIEALKEKNFLEEMDLTSIKEVLNKKLFPANIEELIKEK